jgi:hypothetical protein
MDCMKLLLLLALTLLPCLAQFRNIEITFEGIGCASCVESLPARMQRIRGVESATVDASRGVLKLQLANQNHVRLEQVRDAIEQDGTKAKSAFVVVRGELNKQDGNFFVRPEGVASSYGVKLKEPVEPGSYLLIGDVTVLRPESGPILIAPTKVVRAER